MKRFALVIVALIGVFVMGCEPPEAPIPLPGVEVLTAQDETALQEEVEKLRAAYTKLQDSLPGLVAAEARRRSCVRPATFTVHHDGQEDFRGEVESSLRPLGASRLASNAAVDTYHAEDITREQFQAIVDEINAKADESGIKLPLGSISEFPPCDPVREARSEHLPAFGEERDHCRVMGNWLVRLELGELPPNSRYWMFYRGRTYDGQAMEEDPIQVPINVQSCRGIGEMEPVSLYAMVIRREESSRFSGEYFQVVSYRRVEVPSHRGDTAGTRIELPDVTRQPACPPSAIPVAAQEEFRNILAQELELAGGSCR